MEEQLRLSILSSNDTPKSSMINSISSMLLRKSEAKGLSPIPQVEIEVEQEAYDTEPESGELTD